jgi:hypothetical protein
VKHVLSFGLALLASACGSQNNGDIPPELLSAIERGRAPEADYPNGPTGGEVGDVADNRCIPAWQDPAAVDFDPNALKPICLGDFWDPDQADHKLLLVNTSAIWCQVCQVEYQGSGSRQALGKEVKSRHKAGLRVLGSLFQNGQYDPASVQDGVNWAKAFQVDFPFGIDSKFEFGAFATADVQPLNMVVDTRSMKILLKAQDGEAAWAVIDALLAE